jgi:hypothetical protein
MVTPFTPRLAAARCLVAIADYHDAGETPRAAVVMATAVREVVGRCGDWAFAPAAFVTSVLYPPGKVLADQYGSVRGGELFAAFLRAFLDLSDAAVVPESEERRGT